MKDSYWDSCRSKIVVVVAFLAFITIGLPTFIKVETHRRLVEQSDGLLTSSEVHAVHSAARAILDRNVPDFGFVTADLQPVAPGRFEIILLEIRVFKQHNPNGVVMVFEQVDNEWVMVFGTTIAGWK